MFDQKILHDLESNEIIILGLGREGFASYDFLRKNFPSKKLLLIDEKPISKLEDNWQKIISNDENLEFSNNLPDNFINFNNHAKTIIIKSPGIPPTNKVAVEAKKAGIEINSGTNIFFSLLKSLEPKNIEVIGITGTKGKSTVSAMIYHVLKNCGLNTLFGGNIGIPPLSLWSKIKKNEPTIIVMEMSSHQLSDLNFSPSTAVILNITPEHLDYYSSFKEYIKAKSQISRFQTKNDLVIFNDKQKIPAKLANLSKAKQITFNFEKNIKNNSIVYQNETIINLNQLPVLGKHNILNSIPSIIIAKNLGCKTSDINKSLQTFKTLPHRLEFVAKINNITYINDSLSTTPESTMAAIQSFDNFPIILIAGGYDRNLNFTKLAKAIENSNVKHLILLPDTGKKIIENLDTKTSINHTFADNMKEAVLTAKSVAKSGDIVLLSPASASFGNFKDYRDRGNQFKELVYSA